MVKTVRNLTVLGAGLGVSAVVGWLLLRESRRGRLAERMIVRSRALEAAPEPVTEIMLPLDKIELQPEPALRPAADDFTRIKDVGPRFAQAMREAGITSFSQLAALTPDALSDMLAPFVAVRAQRIRSNDWIGQARRLATSAE